MAKIKVGNCPKCGKDLKAKTTAVQPTMKLTCKCGEHVSIEIDESIVGKAGSIDWTAEDTSGRLSEVMDMCDITEEEAKEALTAVNDHSADAAIDWFEIRTFEKELETATQALQSGETDPSAEKLYQQARDAIKEDDLWEGFVLYRQAATLGHLQAVGAVGLAFHYGAGVRQDDEIAETWLALAKEYGYDALGN